MLFSTPSTRPLTLLPLPSFLSCYRAHPYLPSFPTRRSSDLVKTTSELAIATDLTIPGSRPQIRIGYEPASELPTDDAIRGSLGRSEEHTSELQSLTNLVCRLLLEKKNKSRRRSHVPCHFGLL